MKWRSVEVSRLNTEQVFEKITFKVNKHCGTKHNIKNTVIVWKYYPMAGFTWGIALCLQWADASMLMDTHQYTWVDDVTILTHASTSQLAMITPWLNPLSGAYLSTTQVSHLRDITRQPQVSNLTRNVTSLKKNTQQQKENCPQRRRTSRDWGTHFCRISRHRCMCVDSRSSPGSASDSSWQHKKGTDRHFTFIFMTHGQVTYRWFWEGTLLSLLKILDTQKVAWRFVQKYQTSILSIQHFFVYLCSLFMF